MLDSHVSTISNAIYASEKSYATSQWDRFLYTTQTLRYLSADISTALTTLEPFQVLPGTVDVTSRTTTIANNTTGINTNNTNTKASEVNSSSSGGHQKTLQLLSKQQPCHCIRLQQSSLNLTELETAGAEIWKKAVLQAIVQELTIPFKNTSASNRRLNSAKDGRTSSAMFGILGAVLCLTPVVIIVVMDVFSLLYHHGYHCLFINNRLNNE